ncbi:protein shifted-like [Cylas formicarius]|uniref:protein shifted-like n=1 Tax=Cylas formicarius TaxID=197179 RepID=UPI002958642E|nr:protein shifted-like [Cylas formicarius]
MPQVSRLMFNFILSVFISNIVSVSSRNDLKNDPRSNGDLALWIDEKQVKMFSGMSMEIYAILNGNVLPYILDPNFENYLPVIPSEVRRVNFTWKAGLKKYYYNFDQLQSYDEKILQAPEISIKPRGRVPKKPKEFSIFLTCTNTSGIARFGISLLIENRKGKALDGTPLRLKLRKECSFSQRSPDPECDKKCANQGWCNNEKICQCPEGYMGQYCKTALCYPQCMNGGICTSPGVCSCPLGFQGRHCEGGICSQKCLNGGKCVQKDTCDCSKGYYGPHCEFSRCIIPCLNGGKCKAVNKCRCQRGFRGDHCEVGPRFGRAKPHRSTCALQCKHGTCVDDTCICEPGWYGRLCHHSAAARR